MQDINDVIKICQEMGVYISSNIKFASIYAMMNVTNCGNPPKCSAEIFIRI